MSLLLLTVLAASLLASLFFATLTYALRDFSRARLADYLELREKTRLLEPITRNVNDLIFITALARLTANILILLCLLRAMERPGQHWWTHYLLAAAFTLPITLLCSVALPHAASRHAAESIIGVFAGFLLAMRLALLPLTRVMHWVDALALRLAGGQSQPEPEEIEQEILSVVEEGQKEGIVDQQEREMIESVIDFRDTQVGQIMTARPEIVAIEIGASLDEIKKIIEESGHSRIPVYNGTLDQILGILYARDLLKHLGQPTEPFNIRSAIRPAMFVPETKPLRDLLREFRQQKVHIAIVADEYGGTAGLATIEDILEELVGEISDEHEPAEPAQIRRLGEGAAEVDARMYLVDVNRQLDLSLPEDAGYETLGGFVSVTLGRIPPVGTSFEHQGLKFTILSAAPQRVERVKIERLAPRPAPASAGETSKD